MKKYLLLLFFTSQIMAGNEPVFDLTTLDGTNGFVSMGTNFTDFSGAEVDGAGDFNGDGIEDFILSAVGFNNYAGKVFVVYGDSNGYQGNLQLDDIDGTNGFVIEGLMQQDVLGSSVAGVGDINNDGFDDIAIGATGANNNSGAAYFIFGTDSGIAGSINLALLDGSDGFVLNAEALSGSNLGGSIASAGDFNDDGIDDVIIGADRSRVDNSSPIVGAVYILYGRGSFNSTMSTSELSGNSGSVIYGAIDNGNFGDKVTDAGDINGDGVADLIVAEYLSSGIESVYVIFADQTGFPDVFDVSSLNGSNGFAIKGEAEGQSFGQSIGSAFDLNHDGFDDVLIGAPDWTSELVSQKGLVYVVYGKSTGFSAVLNVSTLDGSNGFVINGDITGFNDEIKLGIAVSAIGDFNGDLIDDVVVSTRGGGSFFNGSCHVIYGNESGFGSSFDVNLLDGENGFSLFGINTGDTIGESLSKAGDINGDGIDDFLIGAPSESTNASSSGAVYSIFGKADFVELMVTKQGDGTGVVMADSGLINCGDTCTDEYALGTVVTLTATADSHMEFVGWAGADCAGTGTCEVTMDQSKEIIAEFINTDVLFKDGFE